MQMFLRDRRIESADVRGDRKNRIMQTDGEKTTMRGECVLCMVVLAVIVEQHTAVSARDIRCREVLARIFVSDDGLVDVLHRI